MSQENVSPRLLLYTYGYAPIALQSMPGTEQVLQKHPLAERAPPLQVLSFRGAAKAVGTSEATRWNQMFSDGS